MQNPLLFLAIVFLDFSGAIRLDLGGNDWTYTSKEVYGNSSASYTGQALVPGDIYMDLYRNGQIGNPLYGMGDKEYLWVGRSSWVYEKIFDVSDDVIKTSQAILVFESIDTIADVYFNDQKLWSNLNTFIPVQLNVKNLLKSQNNLTLIFTSSVLYANQTAQAYIKKQNHILPMDCPPEEYHGECHVNFIRKPQSSYSWDWGPAFATIGLAGEVYLDYFDEASIYMDQSFNIDLAVSLFCKNGTSVTLSTEIPELGLTKSTNFTLTSCGNTSNVVSLINDNLTAPNKYVELWWPNGYGAQKLYTMNVQLLVNGSITSSKNMSIGFRTVELVQDYVDPKNISIGRHFYFKINGKPVFLKGTNYIPISAFYAEWHLLCKQFLFESMNQANMNALRVWGGGLFEKDEFYEMADKYGFLLWHDQMFACNLYPRDDEFLGLVGQEVESQVLRLRHHPSILVWAGNNENEILIRGHWYNVTNYNENDMISDYTPLYKRVGDSVRKIDQTRPFLTSSPSNGIESDNTTLTSMDPWSEHYGDVHFYIETANIWKPATFQIPRCATEFGIQSVPLSTTMSKWVDANQWTYGGDDMNWRQHHPNGLTNNLNMTFSHFEIPYECSSQDSSDLMSCSYVKNSKEFMDDFAYLSQIHQAIAMQTESEHYRRFRNSYTADGRGGTMCALYWQLNDIWAAPTWSSIDFDLNWKVLHYYAKRFFAPTIVSMYFDEKISLNVYVVNDGDAINNFNLKIDIFTWEKGLTPILTIKNSVNVSAATAMPIPGIQDEINSKNITLNDNDEFVIRAILLDQNNTPQSPVAILLPDKMKPISNSNYGDATIKSVTKLNSTTYNITLSGTKVVPVLWLDIKNSTKEKYQLLSWFSDNAFTMTDPEVTVRLILFNTNDTNMVLTQDDFIVSRMKMTSTKPTSSVQSSKSGSIFIFCGLFLIFTKIF